MHVADRLQQAAENRNSIACVGLDPQLELIPTHISEWATSVTDEPDEQVAAAFLRFNKEILDAIQGRCAAVKPQSACYEAYGTAGWRCLQQTISYAKSKGFEVVLDAKRGDIGSTALLYRYAVFGGAPLLDGGVSDGLGVDWVTASPYLGTDSVKPLLGEEGEHGIFLLAQTSNPSAGDVQGLATVDGSVSDKVAGLIDSWVQERKRSLGGYSDIGAVVGATRPQQAKSLRTLMPESVFLVPGYGAQGADATAAVAGERADGGGILVNASRSIIGAWRTSDMSSEASGEHAECARGALEEMNSALNSARN